MHTCPLAVWSCTAGGATTLAACLEPLAPCLAVPEILKAGLLALFTALAASPICAQMAGDGEPRTSANVDGGNWPSTCNTMSAIVRGEHACWEVGRQRDIGL
jgi:hypothetical protein